MTQSKTRLTAMTAIAAVLALATPVNAQDAQPAPVTTPDPLGATPPTTAPVPSTEPAPTTTTVADPLSATTAVEAVPATTTAPAAEARTTPRRATTAARAPVRAATPARSTPRIAAARSPAPTSPAPLQAVETAAPIVAARPSAVTANAAVQAPAAPPTESVSNDVLPIAAAGGLGLLALLGTGVALRRRKRREEELEYAERDEPAFEEARAPVAFAEPMREPSIAREPSMAHEPMMAAPIASVSRPIDAPAQTLPDGFDLSRFGPHVQAAYRGPTEDNPSLSLKNRLRRGSAMDQMARNTDGPAQQAAPRPLAAATAARDTGAVMSKVRPAPSVSGSFILGGEAKRPAMRPVTQH